MSDETDTSKVRSSLTDDEIDAIATDFENREFESAELTAIRKTRRRSPRLGEARAEVYTFRAPPSYKRRIQEQAAAQDVTESQVIRDALDAYLSAS
ncbi:ribbon-helix-helix protein, CopG family [Candidatus Poriferisodalis sp.]|uniref:ribbon-helix-helix protein, CopG family n=1 Tax=Candidatus Poriferisodalis sp. TaxID=3101277 RepID=UPI003B018EDE